MAEVKELKVKSESTKKPVAKPAAKPAVKLAAQSKPAVKPVVKPAAKPVAKPAAKSKPASKPAAAKKFFNRLHEKYVKEVAPALLPKYKNINAVPRIEKIVVNTRLGDVRDNTKSLTGAVEELGLITGQKPIITLAKKSISNFKLREGQKIGAVVTLRGSKMYEFLDKVLSIALPRVRDFSGISPKSFDRFGNYSLGFKEQLVFPEISYEKIEKVRGFDITIVTTAKNKEDSLEFLTSMGFPFKKEAK
jgi:large subunit ribosomal protein L5